MSKDGLKPDPMKKEAIVKMKHPTNVGEVQRLAGMVNCLAKFLPDLPDADATMLSGNDVRNTMMRSHQ